MNRFSVLLISIFIANNPVFSSDSFIESVSSSSTPVVIHIRSAEPTMGPDSREQKAGESSQVSAVIDPYSYVLGKIQTGIEQGATLDFEKLYDGFEKTASQYGWSEVKARTVTLGNKRIAALELLTNVLSALGESIGATAGTINSLKGYINSQLAQAFGKVSSSLKITPQQEEVMVRALAQLGKQEATKNQLQPKTASQWADVFRAGRNYEVLEPSLLRDIFFKTLVTYDAQKRGDQDTDIIKEIAQLPGFDQSHLTSRDLEKFLKKCDGYAAALLTDSPQILDQRGGIVTALIQKGQEAAKEGSKKLNTWRDEFSHGKSLETLTLSQQQDILFKTLIAYTAQEKAFSQGEEGTIEKEAVTRIYNKLELFSPLTLPANLLGQLQYFQGLEKRKNSFQFNPNLRQTPLTLFDLATKIGSYLDIQSLINMTKAANGPKEALKGYQFYQLSQLLISICSTAVVGPNDPRLEAIFKLLHPKDLAYLQAEIANYLKVETKPDEVKELYKKAIAVGSQEAKNELNYAAFIGKFGFICDTGRQYLEERAALPDQNAQEYLNYAAYLTFLDFTRDTGRQYLEERAALADQDARERLYKAVFRGEYGFTEETGRRYLEERAESGDQDAQKWLNKAAFEEGLGFWGETRCRYLEERAESGDQDAQKWLNKAAFMQEPGYLGETGRLYLEERAKSGDQDAQKWLNKAAYLRLFDFTRDTGRQYLEKRVHVGDQDAQVWLSKVNSRRSGDYPGVIKKQLGRNENLRILEEAYTNFFPKTLREAVLKAVGPLLNTYR